MRYLFRAESPQSFEHDSCAIASLSGRSISCDVTKTGEFLSPSSARVRKVDRTISIKLKSDLCKPALQVTSKVRKPTRLGSENNVVKSLLFKNPLGFH